MGKSTLGLTRTDRVRVSLRALLTPILVSALLTQYAAAQGEGAGEAVITIHGFCVDEAISSSRPCDTVITRAQFDHLAEALQPDMPRPLRLKVATTYARMMRMAAAAEKRGLDKTAAFAEQLRYARLQLLSQDLTRVLQEEAQHVSNAEISDYYDQHRQLFERATLERVFVPGSGPKRVSERLLDQGQGHPREGFSAPQGGADLTALAITLRARAIAGESPEALQAEAFRAAGESVADPHTKMENVLRESLPPSHEGVMDLRVGEVSEVLSDPGGGHFIYKMISKDTPSLESVSPEIRKLISSQRYRDSLKGFEGDVVFNDAYFDPPGAPPAAAEQSRRTRSKPRHR